MTWWKDDARERVGWQPLDSADPFAGQLAGKVSGDPGRGALHGWSDSVDSTIRAMRRHRKSCFDRGG